MKKLTWLFVLMVVCGALYAQTSKEIFNATLVPNAPIVLYADGSGLADNEFVKLAKKYEVELQAMLTNNAAKATGDAQMKMKEFWDSVKKDLNLSNDDIVKWQVSVNLGGMQFGAGEPDFAQLDVLVVAELKKALNPEQVKTALLAADKKCGDGDAEDKADLTVAERNGAKLLSVFIKETDETADMPAALRRLQCGFVGDGKFLVAGPEKSVFAALERVESKTPAPKHSYIQKLFNDQEYGFLAIGMFPQLKNFLSGAAARAQEGDPNQMAAKAMSNADGIAFTTKVTDKLTIALNLDMGQAEDAAMLKGQMWDAMVAPMLQQLKPMIIGKVGGELPLLDTLKCAVDAKRMAISFDMKETDINNLIKFLKTKAGDAPAPAPAQP
ncbi:MAG: hypothetical protein J6T46_02640 [Victivallales bacterium]|nr:hypothetical protein [Victivallales bacterium]MBO7619692.1 hypothetical protein [Victivallales bacterium]